MRGRNSGDISPLGPSLLIYHCVTSLHSSITLQASYLHEHRLLFMNSPDPIYHCITSLIGEKLLLSSLQPYNTADKPHRLAYSKGLSFKTFRTTTLEVLQALA